MTVISQDADGLYVPIDVTIKNWPDAISKPPDIAKTTVKTYIIDPATSQYQSVQICDYEPRRVRLVIQVIDAPIAVLTQVPTKTPDIASVAGGPPNEGRYLPTSLNFEGYCFYGSDPMWINSITGSATSRVTVTKEYRSQ